MARSNFIYKIRDMHTGLFYDGYCNKEEMIGGLQYAGKTWKIAAPLKKYLRNLRDRDYNGFLDRIEIVKYKLVEVETTDVGDFLNVDN